MNYKDAQTTYNLPLCSKFLFIKVNKSHIYLYDSFVLESCSLFIKATITQKMTIY